MQHTGLLLGLGRRMLPLPRFVWQGLMGANARKVRAGLGFMSEEHHRIRDFVVTELPRAGSSLSPESIAAALALPLPRVESILKQLERRLMFLFRNDRGEVTWAYPVTVDETPHRAVFSTGEEAFSP